MKLRKMVTPEWVRLYLEYREDNWSDGTIADHRHMLKNFHAWMNLREIPLGKLTEEIFQEFLKVPLNKPVTEHTQKATRKSVIRYLYWLNQSGKLIFDVKKVFPNERFREVMDRRLPDEAWEYLNLIKATLARNTVAQYASSLTCFYRFLEKKNIQSKELNRRHLEKFIIQLSHRDCGEHQRRYYLIHIRAYLRWLHEHGYITPTGDSLIRYSDLPKKLDLLARPFPPHLDREIQTRLRLQSDLYAKGLLLMRYSGVRIRELVELRFNCVKKDYQNNLYLKVELGKLKSERIVPIDGETEQLIQSIQTLSLRYAKENGVSENLERLIFDPYSRKSLIGFLRRRLKEIARDFPPEEKIVTHRLRHSYATSLLNAGMSLPALMKCMGHRDIAMTLKYTAVANETIRKEFNLALAAIKQTYELPQKNLPLLPSRESLDSVPLSELPSLLKTDLELRKIVSAEELFGLLKRVKRLQEDLRILGSK